MINPELDKAIISILEQGSTSEFELIKTLQKPPYCLFEDNVFANELSLFQTHFVIHNALYRLRDIGLAQGLYDIDTLTTQISLIYHSKVSSKTEQTTSQISPLTVHDRPEVIKLREYYLDWCNFEKTGEQDVAALLASFWQTYSKFDRTQQNEQLKQALASLGFEQLPTMPELKTRYKKLSTQIHPDKGGTVEEFQILQQVGGRN